MDDRPVFDAAKFKTTTRAMAGAAEAWHRWGPFLGEWLGAATEQMLDLAHIKAGSRVLDIAAGAGEQSLAAARRSGRPAMCWPPTSRPLCSTTRLQMRVPPDFRTSKRASSTAKHSETCRELRYVISRVGLIYFRTSSARWPASVVR